MERPWLFLNITPGETIPPVPQLHSLVSGLWPFTYLPGASFEYPAKQVDLKGEGLIKFVPDEFIEFPIPWFVV